MIPEFEEIFRYLFQRIFAFLDTTLFAYSGFNISILDVLIGFFVLYIIVDNFVPKA